jgi:hypothetical protein
VSTEISVSTESSASAVATVEVVQFVRGTLGCHCADEVFRSITIEPSGAADSAPVVRRLTVGGRLLIHVVAVPPDSTAVGWLERLVTDGVSQRDLGGFNRFRLVLVAPDVAETPADLESRFARAAGSDDRAHLHLVAASELPPSLRPPVRSAANRR